MRRVINTISALAVVAVVTVGAGATAGASTPDVDAFTVGRSAALAVSDLVAGRTPHTAPALTADQIAAASAAAFIPPATVTVTIPGPTPTGVDTVWGDPIVSHPAPTAVGDPIWGDPVVSHPTPEPGPSAPDGATWTPPILADGAKDAARGAETGFSHPSDTELSR